MTLNFSESCGGFVASNGGGSGTADDTNDVFVFKPGGAAGGRVFVTLPSLYTALNAEDGPKVVSIDDSVTSPAVIDVTDATAWVNTRVMGRLGSGNSFGPSATLHIADGTSTPGLLTFGPNINVLNNNLTTSPVTLANADVVNVTNNSDVSTVASGVAMFSGASMSSGQLAIVFVTVGSSFGLSTDETIVNMPVSGTLLFILVGAGSSNDDDSLVSAAGVSRFDRYLSSGGHILRQPGWLGSVATTSDAMPRLIQNPAPGVAAATSNVATATFGQLLRCNTSGGGFTQALPAIAANSNPGQGVSVTVKEESGTAGLLVDGAGSDTIDGASGAVAIPAGGSLVFTSDGVSDWAVTGGYSSGSGDVVGPGSAADSNLVAFDGTSGKLIKDSGLRMLIACCVFGAKSDGTGNFLIANGKSTDGDDSTKDKPRHPIAIDGTLTRLAYKTKEGDTTTQMKIHINGVVEATVVLASMNASNGGVETVSVSVSAGDYFEIEYDAAQKPGECTMYFLQEVS